MVVEGELVLDVGRGAAAVVAGSWFPRDEVVVVVVVTIVGGGVACADDEDVFFSGESSSWCVSVQQNPIVAVTGARSRT